MKTLVLFSLILCSSSVALAEFALNPDPNTLWREDGANIAVGDMSAFDQWRSGAVDVSASPTGGFIFKSTGMERTTGRSIPLHVDYPWLSFQITEVAHTEGYRGWILWLLDEPSPNVIGQSMNVQKGLYHFRLWPRTSKPTGSSGFLRVDMHHTTLTLQQMQMIRQPLYWIELDSPAIASNGKIRLGDTILFRVHLPEEAEDVSLAFFDAHLMSQIQLNGQNRLQLKPESDNGKVWIASMTLQSGQGYSTESGQGPRLKPGRLWIKATILGGAINIPVWTCNDIEIDLNP